MSGEHFVSWDEKPYRSRCKNLKCQFFTHLFCLTCKVHFCITAKRNCFLEHHRRLMMMPVNTLGRSSSKKSKQKTTPLTETKKKGSDKRVINSGITKRSNVQQKKKIEVVNSATTRLERRAKGAKQIICTEEPKRTSSQHLQFMSMLNLAPVVRKSARLSLKSI